MGARTEDVVEKLALFLTAWSDGRGALSSAMARPALKRRFASGWG
ncbi:MAG: hypothetical protein ACLS6G_08230 [Christensenellales bacterium]